jgi:S-adenosyl methyltransferase
VIISPSQLDDEGFASGKEGILTDDRTVDQPAPASAGTRVTEIDPSKAHIARVYNYWLGGKDHYAADEEAAEQVIASYPNIRTSVRAQRAFLGRAVHFLTADVGIRQFLDIGTGLPSANNTHEVAQREAPESRIVYVDHDPVVLTHARALLTSSPEGATAYIDADLRNTAKILREAADTLDFRQPVAVMLVGVLHCIPDDDDPATIVARLMAAVPSGSYLVVAHPASDVDVTQVSNATTRFNRLAAEPVRLRTHAEVRRFFDGLDLVEPGVVQLHRWRGDADANTGLNLANYGAIGRKP